MEQLISDLPPCDATAAAETLRRAYQLEYIADIRLIGNWRRTYKVVHANLKMIDGLARDTQAGRYGTHGLAAHHGLRRVHLFLEPYHRMEQRSDRWERQSIMYSPDSDGAYSSDDANDPDYSIIFD